MPAVEREALAAKLEDARQETVARQELDSRGKSANEVLAARISTMAVTIWSRQ